MMKINLLPREVLERRRYEKWYGYVFIAFGVLLLRDTAGVRVSLVQRRSEDR